MSMRPWLWIAVTSIPFWSKVWATGFTSLSISTKSPVIAAFPSATGWKFRTVVTPMAGSNGCPISVMDSVRGTVTWNTPPPISRPDAPERLLDLLRDQGPARWPARKERRTPRGVPLADSAWRSAVASLRASPWPS